MVSGAASYELLRMRQLAHEPKANILLLSVMWCDARDQGHRHHELIFLEKRSMSRPRSHHRAVASAPSGAVTDFLLKKRLKG